MRAVALAAAIAALAAAGCGVRSPEEQLLDDFFQAARLRDRTMLAGISTIDFNPRTDGVVQDFRVSRVVASGGAGDRQVREVTVSAQVRRLDGPTSTRMLQITLERIDGRWLVTALQPQQGR